MKYFIFLTAVSIFNIFILQFSFGQSIIMNGIIRDYKWAHHSNKLAILCENNISVFEPGKPGAILKINTPDYFSSIEWTKDDNGFLLGKDNIVYKYNKYKNYPKKYIKINGCGSTWDVVKISASPDSKYWACISSCETFPTLHIMAGKKRIKSIDFGKAASAELLIKHDTIFICINPYFKEDGDLTFYGIIPGKEEFSALVHNSYSSLNSFDGKFFLSIQQNEDETTTVTITRLNN